MTLLEHECLAVNQVLLNIYKAENELEMRLHYLDNIRLLIPYSKASFYLADFHSNSILREGVGVNFGEGVLSSYPNELINYDYGKWIYMTSDTKVYRTSDWFPECMRESSDYYQKAFVPNGIHYEVRLPLYYNDALMGFTALFRTKEETDFTDKELFILGLVMHFLAYYLYKNVFLVETAGNKRSGDTNLASQAYHLTPREAEILKLIFAEKSNEQIAQELFITQNTCKKHLMNIYRKLNISSKNELYKIVMNSR